MTQQSELFSTDEYMEIRRIQMLPPPVPFDECECPNHGRRFKSRSEVYQVERDEVCLYATLCDGIVDEDPPLPF